MRTDDEWRELFGLTVDELLCAARYTEEEFRWKYQPELAARLYGHRYQVSGGEHGQAASTQH